MQIQLAKKDINALLAKGLALGKTRPLMASVARVVSTDTDLRFRTGTAPSGRKWKAPKYRQGQPLRDTGRLQRSITTEHGDEFAVIGTNLLYAKVHQFGAVIKPVKAKLLRFPIGQGQFAFAKQVTIPARPFLGIGPSAHAKINAAMTEWAEEILNAQP